MPIQSRKNLYHGVNAHLHSYFQAQHEWKSFHGLLISALVTEIYQRLPAGYIVNPETSLQIREIHPDTGERIRRPEPDLSIRQLSIGTPLSTGGQQATMMVAVEETIATTDDLYLTNLVIYQLVEDERRGKPLTVIEILSPSNKPPGDGFLQYREKRISLLKSGLNLVEVDLLHETAPPMNKVPSYPHRDKSAYPYYIAVNNPHPNISEGKTAIFGFSIDTSLPHISIPLANDQSFIVNFDAAYHAAFAANSPAYEQFIDYEQPPAHFEKYTPTDQERIKAVMQRAKDAVQSGNS